MPAITLTFSAPLNTSCQVGDTVYYVSTGSSGGFTINSSSIVEIGQVREISGATTNAPIIIAETTLGYNESNGLTDKFILFSKDNKANLSSPLGYYAAIKMVNDNSADAGEMFSMGVEIFESSGQGAAK
tara:strand:+ start:68 stop:454 length:387 start_codon:yes stop_codon:yes gene_type:complete